MLVACSGSYSGIEPEMEQGKQSNSPDKALKSQHFVL